MKSAKFAASIAVLVAISAFGATADDRQLNNPRVLGETQKLFDKNMTIQGLPLPGLEPLEHERVLDLKVVYTDGYIFNPATGRNDKVRLRSYNGTDVDPTTPYVSPTIEVKPGDTIRVNLRNELPQDPTCDGAHPHANTPHCFNGTNLHTHGLWVNPAGNGDNVLLSINPGVSFQYEYNIPSDHPAGTFWYHTHRHGSTALQVSSGMAGALIVRGVRLPGLTKQGDLDTVLRGIPERILMFQQIQYACRKPGVDGKLGDIKLNSDNKSYRCDPDDVGGIEGYDQFGPPTWGNSGRYTSINGLVIPTFKTKAGQLERWRMIHGGVRDTITLKIVEMQASAQLAATFTKTDAAAFLKQSCNGATVAQDLVAADGLTLAKVHRSDVTTFQPGYRFDSIMIFPKPGRFCVVNMSAPKAGSVNADDPGPELLGIVEVEGGTDVADPSIFLKDALVANARNEMPSDIAATIIADLEAGLKLTRFTPHPDIADDEVIGKQELTFFIDTSVNPLKFSVSNTASAADANPYDPDRIDRKLTLGTVDEWALQSAFVSHPFHIHINPFQIVSILDPKGRDVSAEGMIDDADNGKVDPQYPGLKGVWKDTLWIKSLEPGGGMYKITVRTRYQRYIGQFVLHCHILDHEDQGMMQNVAIVLPGSNTVSDAGDADIEQHMHK
nr:multicopper oxidase domain-containing protein [Rhizobium ruizarguesonis]